MPDGIVKPWALVMAGAVLFAAALGGVGWYGHARYEAGRADEKAAALAAQQAAQAAMQEERDRADAQYRGAVLARQTVEAQVVDLRGQVSAAADRIVGLDGLLQQYRNRPAPARASGGPYAAGPDWIGIFGECVGRVERLSNRLAAVGNDAARWADQVNGLQGYISGVTAASGTSPTLPAAKR